MGSCISICRPKKPPQEHQDLYDLDLENHQDRAHVRDKLVINIPTQEEAPKITKTPPISAPSPSNSCSSLSSFSCNTNGNCASSCSSSSLSSASSNASSILSSKDRTFSNEFLWTCVKDNPHIIRTIVPEKPKSHVVQVLAPAKQSMVSPQRATPQKRVRSSSPNQITRQKSFRKDPPPPDLYSRTSLRSPSPSRRFSGGGGSKVNSNQGKSLSLARNKENLRPQSPDLSRVVGQRSGLRNREAVSVSKNSNGLRLDEAKAKANCSVGVGDDLDVPMEDIDNPLISLDCFIFL